jgi:transposase
MTGSIDRVEVITSVQRRRRWSAEEKARIFQETYAPGMSVSLVARQHGIAPNQVFTWRRLYGQSRRPRVAGGIRRSSARPPCIGMAGILAGDG